MSKIITFDRAKIKKLERQYNKAVKDSQESFMFEKNEMSTGYAKYLIQYLKGEFIGK